MSSEKPAPITGKELDDWLMALPPKERKAKILALAAKLRRKVKTITNWRQGRPIPEEMDAEIREFMKGTDRMSIDFEPAVYRALEAKAKEKGFPTVAEYLTELTKGFLALILLGVVGYQTFHPRSDQSARLIGRRRGEMDDVELTMEA